MKMATVYVARAGGRIGRGGGGGVVLARNSELARREAKRRKVSEKIVSP